MILKLKGVEKVVSGYTGGSVKNPTYYAGLRRIHRDYFALNPNSPYCQAVVGTKVSKFMKRFEEMAKKDE